MRILSFRCPPELWDAAESLAMADGISVNEFARNALAKAASVEIEVLRGIAGADEATRQRVAGIGGRAYAKKRRKAARSK